jgi:hypothetical protein
MRKLSRHVHSRNDNRCSIVMLIAQSLQLIVHSTGHNRTTSNCTPSSLRMSSRPAQPSIPLTQTQRNDDRRRHVVFGDRKQKAAGSRHAALEAISSWRTAARTLQNTCSARDLEAPWTKSLHDGVARTNNTTNGIWSERMP